jgi:Ca-activated chloride channel family protein
MTFLWPQLLWLSAIVPLLVIGYFLLLRRQKRAALRYASLKLVRDAMDKGSALRRHVPPLLFLVALAAMLVAMARPAAVVRLPSQHETVVLSIDVSGSMKAKDVPPDRMSAAREAARAFVAEQPRSTRIGIVEFSGTASLVQTPTGSRADIGAALDRLQPQLSTAIGSGILVALKAVFPEAQFNPQTGKPTVAPHAVQPGSYKSAAIILLSDGESNAGPDPLEVAHTAAEYGVRVFTVGLGTAAGDVIQGEGWSMRVALDERTLKSIADITGGEYLHARTAPDLKKVYESLSAKLTLERRETEITALFAALAALVATLAGGLSLAWFNRLL